MNEAQQPEPAPPSTSDAAEPNMSPEARQQAVCNNGFMAASAPAQPEDAAQAIAWNTIEYPPLPLTTKVRIWGDDEAHSTAIEPDLTADQRQQVLLDDGELCCMYCGFQSAHNHVHNLNDNHRDTRPENLAVVCPICHISLHLGEIAPDDAATLAFLPGLSRQDLNHLQRTILIALRAGDEAMQNRARALHDWLKLHSAYTNMAWRQTDKPAAFAEALIRVKDEKDKQTAQTKLRDLAVIFDPEKTPFLSADAADDLIQDTLEKHPFQDWENVLHYVITDPNKQQQGEVQHG